jgi:molybdenum ABC transporter ATP-binding protein
MSMAASAAPAVEIEQLRAGYGKSVILNGVDLMVAAGEFVAILGSSGCGKTTLLRTIAGFQKAMGGLVRCFGRNMADLPPERRDVAMVFQSYALWPHMTVLGNVGYGLRLRGVPREEIRKRVTAILAMLNMSGLEDRKVTALSGGQRQRVALGRALLRGPELLLMDEPLAGVDAEVKERILHYLERAVVEWKVPTIFVSHDQGDVRRLASRVVVLEGGKVLSGGDTVETLDRTLRAGAKSLPGPVNLLRVSSLRQVDGHWEGRVGTQPLYLPPGSVPCADSVHVRFLPHDVVLARDDLSEFKEPHLALSIRNRWHGVVREVLVLGEHIFVAVDIGQFLWAEVTPDSVTELALRPGQPVGCLVKASALSVLLP